MSNEWKLCKIIANHMYQMDKFTIRCHEMSIVYSHTRHLMHRALGGAAEVNPQ